MFFFFFSFLSSCVHLCYCGYPCVHFLFIVHVDMYVFLLLSFHVLHPLSCCCFAYITHVHHTLPSLLSPLLRRLLRRYLLLPFPSVRSRVRKAAYKRDQLRGRRSSASSATSGWTRWGRASVLTPNSSLACGFTPQHSLWYRVARRCLLYWLGWLGECELGLGISQES